MDANEMEQLLGRYYDGQTSDAEEKTLREAVSGGAVAGENGESRFLGGLHSCPDMPEGLEQRLGRQIDSWNTVEKSVVRRTRAASMKWVAGIAAALLVLFSIGVAVDSASDERQYSQKDTYDNAQDAYAQTQKALMEMSESLNKGFDKMEEVTNGK